MCFVAILATTLLGAACRCSRAPGTQAAAALKDPARARAALEELEWRRQDPDGLATALFEHADPTVRARAVLAAGRAGLLASLPGLLKRLAEDSAPTVRADSAFALRLLVLDPPTAAADPALAHSVNRALLARLLAEKDPRARDAVILSLGWVGDAEAAVRLGRELATSEAALVAWGILGQRKVLDLRLAGPLLAVLERGTATQRQLAAWALSRISGPAGTAVVAALMRAGESPDPVLRQWATRSVGQKGGPGTIPWLVKRLGDPDPLVQGEAARALGQTGPRGANRLVEGVRAIWEVVSSGHFRLTGPRLGTLLSALEALRPHAERHEVQQLTKELLESADASQSSVKYTPIEAHAVDLTHCAAAYLWDLAAGRPEETPTCGTARAASLSATYRRMLVARLIGALKRDAPYKVTLLRRYLHDADPAVRTAAVEALASAELPASRVAYEEALRDADAAVVAQAATSLRRDPGRATREAPLLEQLVARLDRLEAVREPEAACAIVETLAALKVRSATSTLQRLRQSPSWAVRSCSAQALVALTGQPAPAATPLSGGLPPLRWAEGRPLPRRAVLVLAKGELHLELYPDRAPATVANFARLAQRGFYRRTPFHRIVPGFVAQGGDPRGDGWGGPGHTTPCELSPAPFDRGSLGMALAGRDTAGSQFFITLGRHPHLDGRYTLFGRVVRGLDLAERIQPGEPIQDLYIPADGAAPAPRDGAH
ncbi:MAG: peptidylprolyl isomerase [Deltaproteobacteria bacterium]|nr:peptidylprolyl isomerase [Deltaproteobacteria bacterium]